MVIYFDTVTDETGKGRVIVDGRFYGLPIEAVLEYKRLRGQEKARNEGFLPVTLNGHAAGLGPNLLN